MSTQEDLSAAARAWAAGDPDPTTRAELEALLAKPHGESDLADRFAGQLEFGTAGLRGVMGAGPNRMNRAVILRTTFGFAKWLGTVEGAAKRGVVIGYDSRLHSREFALDTALVLAAANIRAYLFEDVGPTPRLAFAVSELDAAGGIMITASHNPPEYNGYKVYGPSAAQIVSPTDVEIAKLIDAAPAAKDVPRADRAEAERAGLLSAVPPSVERTYLDRVRALLDSADIDRSFPIVYTPLHGVGGKLCVRALAESGFSNVIPVKEQFEPDGRFPTVAFPNPEEKGAMDLSLALAKREKAQLVLANDPDADRLAVAVPSGRGDEWVQLTGNQVGVLLGHHLLTLSDTSNSKRLVITTIVSSPMLGVMAKALGVHYEETLTGFKWIATKAIELARTEGLRFVFGYEEALGYTVSTLVRDKDGVSTAVVFADLVASLRARGQTVLGELDALSRKYGVFVSDQVSVTKKGADGAAEIRAMMDRFRAEAPAQLGPLAVVATRDYRSQKRIDRASGATTALTLPPSDVVTFELEGGSRFIARPSGTEPKIKFYFDVRELVTEGEDVAVARARAEAIVARMKTDIVNRVSG